MAEQRKIQAGMLALTTFGALFMLPPVVYVFNQGATPFGIPQIVFYLFAVWLLLIVGTMLLTRSLPRQADDGEGER